MRLNEMYYTIKNTLDNWANPSFQEIKQKGGASSLYVCKNIVEILRLLEPLRCLPDVSSCLSEIEKISPGVFDGKTFYLESNERSAMMNELNRLSTKLNAMRSMCETLGMDRDSDGFDVKLPPDITLSDAAQCMSDLDVIFSKCPLFPPESPIKFSGVDIGSTWLMFTIVGAAAGAAAVAATLRIVAELLDKAIAIRSHQLSYKQEEEHLRSLKLSNDAVEHVVSAYKEALDKMIEAAVQELSDSHNVTENEDKERVRVSIERLGKWLDRGMEIHAGINAPEETKLLFPPIEKQSLPQEIVKALESEKKDE